jgi:hypothetical protein
MRIRWNSDDDTLRRYADNACFANAVGGGGVAFTGGPQGPASAFGRDAVVRTIRDLKRISGYLHRLYMTACNDRPLTEHERAAEAELEATAIWLGRSIGLRVFVQDDPRGPAVRVLLPDRRSNNMGGEDWAVSP